jgi:predicted nucleic acid-binding protein
MSLLFDTNALSEPTKKAPNAGFLEWLEALKAPQGPFTTSLCVAEVWQGWHRLPVRHPRRAELRAAKAWGELTARLPKLPVRDSLIAAVALSRSLTVVTRDLVPFAAAGCKVITPWK